MPTGYISDVIAEEVPVVQAQAPIPPMTHGSKYTTGTTAMSDAEEIPIDLTHGGRPVHSTFTFVPKKLDMGPVATGVPVEKSQSEPTTTVTPSTSTKKKPVGNSRNAGLSENQVCLVRTLDGLALGQARIQKSTESLNDLLVRTGDVLGKNLTNTNNICATLKLSVQLSTETDAKVKEMLELQKDAAQAVIQLFNYNTEMRMNNATASTDRQHLVKEMDKIIRDVLICNQETVECRTILKGLCSRLNNLELAMESVQRTRNDLAVANDAQKDMVPKQFSAMRETLADSFKSLHISIAQNQSPAQKISPVLL